LCRPCRSLAISDERKTLMTDIAAGRPQFSTLDAEAIAQNHYGLQVHAEPLTSERDQNFLLRDSSSRKWVLKIASSADSAEALDCQNQILEFLEQSPNQIRSPHLVRDMEGHGMVQVCGRDGLHHYVRLLTWLPGMFLHQTAHHSPSLLRDIGHFMGRLDKALADFSHPAAERELQWDIRLAHRVIHRYCSEIPMPDRRDLIDRLVKDFEHHALPRLSRLRHSVIHNDGNDHNLLVGPPAFKDPTTDGRKIIGIIDFGDMLRTCTVAELAIACAYAILGKPNPLEAAVHVVSGYHAACPLTEDEIAVLFHLIIIRLCASVALSAHQQRIEPDQHYLSISESAAWTALEKLSTINSRLAYYAFRQACGWTPCPLNALVTQWLASHQDIAAPVVDADLRRDKLLVFDLTVGSLQLGGLEDYSETPDLARHLFGIMETAGARVGIGRYNEARALYTSEVFRREGNERTEQRTVHSGVDLFMPPGSPVYAPFDAVVHSIADNRGELDYGPTLVLQHHCGDSQLPFYTLYGHLQRNSMENLSVGSFVPKGHRVACIGDYPENGGWPAHLHFQIVLDMLDKIGDFPGVALPSERDLWLSLSPDPNLILGIPESAFPSPMPEPESVLDARLHHLGRSLSVSYRRPLKIVRGWMQHLYDEEGHPYLDCVNNVAHIGHSHPEIVRAIREQAAVLNTNTRYLHDNIVRYAQRLCATLPDPLRICFFVNSGSEANDLALRLARTHTQRQDVVVVDGAYHGNLTSLIEISPYKFNGPGGSGAPPYVHIAAMPDPYRGKYRGMKYESGAQYAADVAFAAQRAAGRGPGAAAFICESALSCGGQIILPPGYLSNAYQHVRKAGGLCIADEVQVGFGRLGEHFWGFQQQGVVPDIVTMGKPIGNGHPLAAVVTTPQIAASFANGMEYFNTFGGNPVSCAVGLAVLDVLQRQQLQARARDVGNHLMGELRHLMDRHKLIGDVRGLGLFIGVELVRDRDTLEPAAQEASFIIERMKDRGILLSTDGPLHNVLKIKPPMIFSGDDANALVDNLARILQEDFN
jgi:4-aminobutyrate aminotransferase-like enzyme/Ser/Thr protein kinase RdoA (MazF antagonist)/murein DD-endopeptidase MepM/ murein hydrolase activator NlpD